MNDKSVREDLAKRLGQISGPMFADYEPWPKWDAIADECLRQMKWAQEQGWKDYDINIRPMYKAPPITLAPPDWEPS